MEPILSPGDRERIVRAIEDMCEKIGNAAETIGTELSQVSADIDDVKSSAVNAFRALEDMATNVSGMTAR